MRGLRWATISRALAQLLTWANTLVVIRLLSQTDFGLASLAALLANFLVLLNEMGFSVALVQRQVRDREVLRHVFGAVLTLGVLLTGALALGAPLVGYLFNEPRVVPLIRLISIQFTAMSLCVIPQARLSMDMRFGRLSAVGIIASLFGAAGTLIAALNGGGAWSLIIGIVSISVVRAILLNFLCDWIWPAKVRFSKIRHLARFSGLALVERTLWYWYIQVDSLVVARSLGAAQLGIYSVGRQLTSTPLERAMEIINSVALPAFSSVQSEMERVRSGYLTLLRLGSGYAFPVFWGLAAVAEPVVRLVIGSRWLASIVVIQLLGISMPLRMLNSFTAAAVTAVARQDVNIKSLIVAIVVIPVCVVTGSHWGVPGVAAAWTIGFPVVYLVNASLVRRALGISLGSMWAAIWPSALAAGAMWFGTRMLLELCPSTLAPALQLSIAVPFGGITFIAVLWTLSRPLVREMRDFARGLATRG